MRTGPHDHAAPAEPAIEARTVSRRFRDTDALVDVDFAVQPGEIHALLGRNGAGKTTLLRLLNGLLEPTRGTVRLTSGEVDVTSRKARQRIGFVPSGDRSFYNRISGFENLLFFGRLYGLRRADAAARARSLLDEVGLADAAGRAVGLYSHGMQKRLGVARGLLMQPEVLLVDEATHDLDPEGAERIRRMVDTAARGGTAVVWTTQRVDEVRGFAHRVTVLDHGVVRFVGTVAELLAISPTNRYEVRVLRDDGGTVDPRDLQRAIDDLGTVHPSMDEEHLVVALAGGIVLGDALTAMAAAGLRVLACREERSEVEQAILRLGDGTST